MPPKQKPEGDATMPVIKQIGVFSKATARLGGGEPVESLRQQLTLDHDGHLWLSVGPFDDDAMCLRENRGAGIVPGCAV